MILHDKPLSSTCNVNCYSNTMYRIAVFSDAIWHHLESSDHPEIFYRIFSYKREHNGRVRLEKKLRKKINANKDPNIYIYIYIYIYI